MRVKLCVCVCVCVRGKYSSLEGDVQHLGFMTHERCIHSSHNISVTHHNAVTETKSLESCKGRGITASLHPQRSSGCHVRAVLHLDCEE